MEPSKFEKHIKEEMQKREIQPSANAWERVSEQLEPAREVKSNKFLWYSMAASFIGIVIVSSLFFQSEDKPVESDVQIVDTRKKETQGEQDSLISKGRITIDEEQNFDDNNISITSSEIVVPKKELNEESLESRNTESDRIVLNDDKVKRIKVGDLLEDADNSIDLKIKEVLAQVDLLEQNKASLTDAEVDSLLYEAQRQLLTEKVFDKNASVDAMALLNQVEGELDQSFRDQIFEKLKSGFLKVRTAVADRNN